ncbi:D-glycero-beta-D-manno-heptose 1-phosphate adenylyltransferase [Prevotella stercorea]|uniref:D-glycero-beta-D-manno-heptose 1-phosphate adenylyltransferase n=1 Tax=Leyella stercorea TaxID=363265 RepID=UPI001C2BDCBF|nr:D-glycero-beta-D-manno-heptose 1-phosphate adenylyltransferase [Leyella stercorea]MBU9899310.1 D-glycero-beta-D-manno-heptose 1-phosphate adenylyltransferase [Leyella stercorea]
MGTGELQMKTIVIGDLMLDKYVFGIVERVSPESGCPILKQTTCEYQLGGAANVAKQLKRLGANVILFGIIGNDENGKMFKKILKQEGLEVDFLSTYNTDTTCKTRFVNDLHQQMFRTDRETFVSYSDEDRYKIMNYLTRNQICNIVISDYNKGVITTQMCQDIIRYGQRNGINVIIDIKENDLKKYKGATIVKGNKKEIHKLLDKLSQIWISDSSLQKLRSVLNTERLIMTCGEEGIIAVDEKNNIIKHSCQKHLVFDVTGAGDIVTAYISYLSKYKDMSFDRILYFANKAANIKVGRFGNSIVELDEVLNGYIKVLNVHEIIKKTKGKKVVFTNGCFDVIHAGHIDLLQKAKEKGDILVVGLNSDSSIRRLKGNSRPINTLNQRIKVLSSIQYIDYIVVFDDETPLQLIEEIKPNVLVKGGDYKFKEIIGADFVTKNGGQVFSIPFVYNLSSTKIIDKIKL